jgi:NAD(P) transhydrogenase subunit alpha
VASLTVGVSAETAPGERRVALVPAVVGALRARGARVAVEAGAGRRAGFADGAYARAGAEVVGRTEVVGRADVLLGVGRPAGATGPRPIRPGGRRFGSRASRCALRRARGALRR